MGLKRDTDLYVNIKINKSQYKVFFSFDNKFHRITIVSKVKLKLMWVTPTFLYKIKRDFFDFDTKLYRLLYPSNLYNKCNPIPS